MERTTCKIAGVSLNVVTLNTVVVGSGAAGFNAADRLVSYGQKDIAIVTEGINAGTSRNTGSDKQTYYKLTLAGGGSDSVLSMAETLFAGGAMDGDIALCEAALSPFSFYKLVDIGVPFPHNAYGEYIGYKTDHDPRQRATSVGPLTSKLMTEKLEAAVKNKGIEIFDNCMVIRVLTEDDKVRGLLCLNTDSLADSDSRYTLFVCTNVVYATGGPAGLYSLSVFPEGHNGASGFAFEAGVLGKNLTEWQYGIASTKFRWNLSGTYQQVLPTYISTNQDGGDAKEFLGEFFPNTQLLLDAIFLKGYQWPFDPRKIENFASSIVDVLVYQEIALKGRRVFMDFRVNPTELLPDFSNLGEESYTYLKNSEALFGTPIERLLHMNSAAVDLYRDHGIDLLTEPLEIAVCAQHNNGGLSADAWWESNIANFFPVGEVCGSHGIYRPGGSALNAGQCGSTRAAMLIAGRYTAAPGTLSSGVLAQAEERIKQAEGLLTNKGTPNVQEIRGNLQTRMSAEAAHIRSKSASQSVKDAALSDVKNYFAATVLQGAKDLPLALSTYDLLLAQAAYAFAMEDYIGEGGGSRGSYLVYSPDGILPADGLADSFRFTLDDGTKNDAVQEVAYQNGELKANWRKVRPIPTNDDWFENVWNAYRRDEIVGAK